MRGNYKDAEFIIDENIFYTEKREKLTPNSIYLNLENNSFSCNLKVSIIDGDNEQNLTNKGEYFIVSTNKKYELYNSVFESNKKFCRLKFFDIESDKEIIGKWSPDYIKENNVITLKTGENFIGSLNNSYNESTTKNLPLNLGNDLRTPIRKKKTNSSIYLNLENSNFSGSISVKVMCDSVNCTNKGEYFNVESGKKYLLYNIVKEKNFDFVQLEFDKNINNGLWSPDSVPEPGCITLKSGSDSINSTKDTEFNGDKTQIRRKLNNSSIYLNIKKWEGVAYVSIYGINIRNEEKNCTNKAEYFQVEGGKKYLLYNTAYEDKFDKVYLSFDKIVSGKWSPDSIPEKDTIEIKDGTHNNNNSNYLCEPIRNPIKFIDVPYINQNDYPTGCESCSAIMLLKYYGYNITVDDFISKLDKGRLYKKGNILYGPDPNITFVGDPRDAHSYGCYSVCIANTLNKFIKNKYIACSSQNFSIDELCRNLIDEENPCLIWATMNMRETKKTITWNIEGSNKKWTWLGCEHCLLLVGYNHTHYFFNDPYQNHGKIQYEKKLVEKRFQEQGCHSCFIKLNTNQQIIENKNFLLDKAKNITSFLFGINFSFYEFNKDYIIFLAPKIVVKICADAGISISNENGNENSETLNIKNQKIISVGPMKVDYKNKLIIEIGKILKIDLEKTSLSFTKKCAMAIENGTVTYSISPQKIDIIYKIAKEDNYKYFEGAIIFSIFYNDYKVKKEKEKEKEKNPIYEDIAKKVLDTAIISCATGICVLTIIYCPALAGGLLALA